MGGRRHRSKPTRDGDYGESSPRRALRPERVRFDAVTRTGATDRTLSTGYRIVATRRQPRPSGGFLPGRLSPNAHGERGRRPNVLGVHQGKRETGVPMRRPSIVVLLAVVVCTPAGWTGAAVLAQPAAHHRSSTAPPPSAEPDPFRSLARGGYLPGSATRAPSGGANAQAPTASDGRASTVRPPGAPVRPPGRPAPRPAQLVPHPAHRQLGQARHRANSPISTATAAVLPGRPAARRRGVHRQRGRRHHEEQHVPALRAARDERRREGLVVQPHRHAHADVRQAVTELPEAKPELVTAQIHDAESDVMEVRLEDKRLIAQYADGKKEFVIDPDYALGTPYDLRLVGDRRRASTSSTTAGPPGASPRAAAAGTSKPAATCSPTPRRATRRTPSVRSCSTR